MLGRLTGHARAAETVIAELNATLAEIRQQVAILPPEKRPLTMYVVTNEPLMAAGPDTYLGEMIEICGGRNIVTDPESGYLKISPELVVQQDPELLLAPAEAWAEHLDDLPGWENLRAIRDKRVVVFETDVISRCGPRMLPLLRKVAAAVLQEPESFPPHKTSEPARQP